MQATSQIIPHTTKLDVETWYLKDTSTVAPIDVVISTQLGAGLSLEIIDINDHIYINAQRIPDSETLVNKQIGLRESIPWYRKDPTYQLMRAGKEIGVAQFRKEHFLSTHITLESFVHENTRLIQYAILPDIFK